MNKTAEQFKKGDLIVTVNKVDYYYLCEDKAYKWEGKSCHFLTTDLNNDNSSFRVSSQVEKWEAVCKDHFSVFYTEDEDREAGLSDKVVKVVNNLGFSLSEIEKQGNIYYVGLSQYTPLGEDWSVPIWFDGTDKSLIEGIEQRLWSFDVDNEAEIRIENRGKNGTPSSIRALLEDAEWKERQLEELLGDLRCMGRRVIWNN